MGAEQLLGSGDMLFLENGAYVTRLHGGFVSESEIEIELETSKKLLEDILDKQFNSLCFPEGKFNKKVIDIAKKMGYSNLYASIPGFYFDQFSEGVIKRSLVQFASKGEFKAIVKGGNHILSKWYQIKHYN